MASKADKPIEIASVDTSLPSFLFDFWKLEHHGVRDIETQLKGISTSSLCESFVKYQLERNATTRTARTGAPALLSMGVGSLLNTLMTSADAKYEAKTIVDSLDPAFLRRVASQPRLSYKILRLFMSLSPTLQETIDIDAFVLRNESFVRSRCDANEDGTYLLRLHDLSATIHGSTTIDTVSQGMESTTLSIPRSDMPKGGLEILDHRRNLHRSIHVLASDTAFLKTFNRLTRNILHGLDWANVFAAGGMILTTLLHVYPSRANSRHTIDPDLDLYLYGLSPDEANRKVEHIYDVWKQNLPPNEDHRVMKNAKTITFLPTYPHRRIQIVLKLLPSPTDILLNFDLDACAVGYDGTHVLMLPRCVRALETGYSVFSMDLIWGHHLRDRRATQVTRLLKYADRGFGLRFLPSYVRSLDKRINLKEFEQTHYQPIGHGKPFLPPNSFRLDRYPYGEEPGLKTLKRIDYLARDYLRRFCYGVSSLVVSPNEAARRYNPDFKVGDPRLPLDDEEEAEWQSDLQRAAEGEARPSGKRPEIRFSDLAGAALFQNLPDGRRGLGNLEILLRYCEAWAMDQRGQANLARTPDSELVYDSAAYDDMPTYVWDISFDFARFEQTLDSSDGLHWFSTRKTICDKLGITMTSGFSDWSTRRLRRQIIGADLTYVMSKQITLPVLIPFELEDFILNKLRGETSTDLPQHFTDTPCLIPIYKSNTTNTLIPPLPDCADERGNMRFWIITNESMWAGQHIAIDEIFELLWSLFHWFASTSYRDTNLIHRDTSTKVCINQLARDFRRRIVLPEIGESEELGEGLPLKREALLFRPWALRTPLTASHSYTDQRNVRPHGTFFDGAFRYPFDDSLFWAGDEAEGVQ